jgi:class 3 adenylate cyclase
MPIYMDRHDGVGGAPEEGVIRNHLLDVQSGSQHGVSFMTFWHDAHRGHIFCLMEAPDLETARTIHNKSHGNMPAALIEVELPAVEAFLGRISDPPAVAAGKALPGPALRAIMFTDIAGSTAMTERLGDKLGLEMVRAHDSIVRRGLRDHGGREVKHLGDGIMAVFDAPEAAARAGRAMQAEFRTFNAGAADALHVRIGLHVGEPVEESNDFFGLAVQIAARVCQAGAPEAVIVSGDFRLALGQEAACRPLGAQTLKGVRDAVELFELT